MRLLRVHSALPTPLLEPNRAPRVTCSTPLAAAPGMGGEPAGARETGARHRSLPQLCARHRQQPGRGKPLWGRWGSECGSVCCACVCICVCCGGWRSGALKWGWACWGSHCTVSICLFWLLHAWHISPLPHNPALQSVGSILSALVPCLRLYAFLGCQLAKARPQEDADHPYSGNEFFC